MWVGGVWMERMCAHGKGGLGINGGRRRTEREREIVDSGRLCASGWEFFEVERERDADGESMRRSGEQERREGQRGLGWGARVRVWVWVLTVVCLCVVVVCRVKVRVGRARRLEIVKYKEHQQRCP